MKEAIKKGGEKRTNCDAIDVVEDLQIKKRLSSSLRGA